MTMMMTTPRPKATCADGVALFLQKNVDTARGFFYIMGMLALEAVVC